MNESTRCIAVNCAVLSLVERHVINSQSGNHVNQERERVMRGTSVIETHAKKGEVLLWLLV